MNKCKRNLETLRKYLHRDKQGVNLLDAIARDLTSQRKQIASLTQSESKAVATAKKLREELDNVKNEKEQIQRRLEKEKVLHNQTRSEKAKPRTVNVVSSLPTPVYDKEGFLRSFKILRRIAKKPPFVYGHANMLKSNMRCDAECPRFMLVCRLEDVVTTYSPNTLETLGRIATLAAMMGHGVSFVSEHPFSEEDRDIFVNGPHDVVCRWLWNGWIDNREKNALMEKMPDRRSSFRARIKDDSC